MDGPVASAWLAELAGAVQRIDDPYSVGGQPCAVVDALLGEDGIIRPFPGQLGHQELVRLAVPGLPKNVGITASGAQVEEEASGSLSQVSR
jgi:hypothetical protein